MNSYIREESIGRWVSILHRQALQYFNGQFRAYGIGGAHIPLLMHVFKNPGGHQEELSLHYEKDKGTIARAIGKMIEEGFIERVQDPKDKRAYLLYPTEKALKIQPEIYEVFTQWTEILTKGFSEEEYRQALDLFKRMANNICEAGVTHTEEKNNESTESAIRK